MTIAKSYAVDIPKRSAPRRRATGQDEQAFCYGALCAMNAGEKDAVPWPTLSAITVPSCSSRVAFALVIHAEQFALKGFYL